MTFDVEPIVPSEGVDIVRVRKVTPLNTSQPGVTAYVVEAEAIDSARFREYSTASGSLAALCSWCEESEWPAQIAWKRTRFGLNIVSVDKAARR